ncbi:hypothetical protein Tco_0122744 [Tanacetum coccineum]
MESEQLRRENKTDEREIHVEKDQVPKMKDHFESLADKDSGAAGGISETREEKIHDTTQSMHQKESEYKGPSLEEISKLRGTAQQNSMNAILAAEEKCRKAKDMGTLPNSIKLYPVFMVTRIHRPDYTALQVPPKQPRSHKPRTHLDILVYSHPEIQISRYGGIHPHTTTISGPETIYVVSKWPKSCHNFKFAKQYGRKLAGCNDPDADPDKHCTTLYNVTNKGYVRMVYASFDRWDLDFEAWKFCFLPGQIASCLVIFFLSCSLFVAIYLDIDSKIMMIVVASSVIIEKTLFTSLALIVDLKPGTRLSRWFLPLWGFHVKLGVLGGIINQLAGMGIKFEDEIQGLWLLGTLPDTWETFRTSLSNSAPDGVIHHWIWLNSRKGKFADVECYHCHKKGHTMKFCRQLKKENKKKNYNNQKNNAHGKMMMVFLMKIGYSTTVPGNGLWKVTSGSLICMQREKGNPSYTMKYRRSHKSIVTAIAMMYDRAYGIKRLGPMSEKRDVILLRRLCYPTSMEFSNQKNSTEDTAQVNGSWHERMNRPWLRESACLLFNAGFRLLLFGSFGAAKMFIPSFTTSLDRSRVYIAEAMEDDHKIEWLMPLQDEMKILGLVMMTYHSSIALCSDGYLIGGSRNIGRNCPIESKNFEQILCYEDLGQQKNSLAFGFSAIEVPDVVAYITETIH